MLKGKPTGMSSQLKPERLKEDRKGEEFEFLIPEIPPLKNEKNIIPTGKQIPRTPLKHEIIITRPSIEPSNDSELCSIPTDELLFKNMIPKGREIPRTPPSYSNLPFLMSGCQVNPSSFLQPIDLGVKPLEDVDDCDDDHLISEDNITFRKRPLPKAYNLDVVLSEMIEVVQLEDLKKCLVEEETQKESTKLCISVVSDNGTQDSEISEEKRQQCSTLSNIGTAENSFKDIIKNKECMGVGDSIMKDKPNEDKVVKKKTGRPRRVPKGSSSKSKQDKECCDTNVELEMDRNKENLLVTKQKGEISESSEKGRRKCNKREQCSLPSACQTRRNPSRRAKEGVNYRLSEN